MAPISTSASTLPWLVRRSAALTREDLPSVVGVGALGILTVVPLAVALVAGLPLFAALAVLPPALMLTGVGRFAAAIVAGERATVRGAFHVDIRLGSGLAVAGGSALLLIGTNGGRPAGEVLVAALALSVPFVVGYGAVRGCSGMAAWRGGLLLVAYRPSWALSLLALSIISAFAMVASGGVLLVLAPSLTVLGVAMCAVLLDEIDASEGR